MVNNIGRKSLGAMIGYRSQFELAMGFVTGSRATEGEGIYVSAGAAKNWAHYIAPNKFEVEFSPSGILPAEEAYFYRLKEYPNKANSILEPIKGSDSIWLRLNKLALERSGYLKGNKDEAIQSFGKILRSLTMGEGYNVISLNTPTEGQHFVILDKNIISRFENVSSKMDKVFRGKFGQIPASIKSQNSPKYQEWYDNQIAKLEDLWQREYIMTNRSLEGKV
ncbi:MAG: hypothetical protein AABY15_00850 [Nanoarchaeota archaeon]